MEFGEKLKALRTERGMTQEQLASRLYVTRTAVSKWETGGGSPNLDSLQALARLFEVSIDDLLSTDDLIALARDERRSTARGGGFLAFGLLDALALLFAILPLYGVRDGEFVRMDGLLGYGEAVGYGIPFVCIITAIILLVVVSVFELVLSRFGTHGATHNVAIIGFVVQAVSVIMLTATMQPYATALLFALLMVKAIIGYRILRS